MNAMNANAPSFSPLPYDNSVQKYIEKNTIIPIRKDDIEDSQRHYVLNISNRQLYSDFGGGVKKKLSPYEGLTKELSEEVPQWADNKNIIIYNEENLSADDRNIRTETMIIFQIEKNILSSFRGTEEVRDLVVMNFTIYYLTRS